MRTDVTPRPHATGTGLQLTPFNLWLSQWYRMQSSDARPGSSSETTGAGGGVSQPSSSSSSQAAPNTAPQNSGRTRGSGELSCLKTKMAVAIFVCWVGGAGGRVPLPAHPPPPPMPSLSSRLAPCKEQVCARSKCGRGSTASCTLLQVIPPVLQVGARGRCLRVHPPRQQRRLGLLAVVANQLSGTPGTSAGANPPSGGGCSSAADNPVGLPRPEHTVTLPLPGDTDSDSQDEPSLLVGCQGKPPPSALPPKIVRRIHNLEFVDIADLLPENWRPREDPCCSLSRRPTSCRALVMDILLWVEGYPQMVAVLASLYPSYIHEFMAYLRTIVRASRNYEGSAWAAYDVAYWR